MLEVFTAGEIWYANPRAQALSHDSQRGRAYQKGTYENEEATVPISRISLSREKTARHVNISRMSEKDYPKGANIEGMLNGEVTKLV